MNNIYNQLFKLQENNNDQNEEITIDYVNKIVNPFEFIHSNVPGSIISVNWTFNLILKLFFGII